MRLKTFGTLQILRDDVPAADVGLARRPLAMLAVMASEGSGGVTRDRLMGLFWPDQEPEKARHSLDQVLYVARRAIGADLVLERPASIELNAAVLPSDVEEFQSAVARGDLVKAVGTYTGAFLDGLYLSEAAAFERWVEEKRDALSHAHVRALTELATEASDAGDFARAVTYARRAAASEPLSTAVAHTLMVALYQAGDPSAAVDAGRVHSVLVRDELDAEPAQAVRDLMEAIRKGTFTAPARRTAITLVAPAQTIPPALTGAAAATQGPPAVASGATLNLPLRRATRARVAAIAVAVGAVLLVAGISRSWLASGRQLPAAFGPPRQVTFTGSIVDLALSPNGELLAYIDHDSLFIQDLAGGGAMPVATESLIPRWHKWSRDGTELWFMADRAADHSSIGWYVVPRLGGRPHLFTGDPGVISAYSMLTAPSSASDSGQQWAIMVWPDTLPRDTLRMPPGFWQMFMPPALSPSGRWVAWSGSFHDSFGIALLSRDGKRRALLTTPGGFPRWSAQGDRVDYVIKGGLMTVRIDTTALRIVERPELLLSDPQMSQEFSISADRTRIAFERWEQRYQVGSLRLHESARGPEVTLSPLTTGTASNKSPAIAPSGKQVAFVRNAAGSEDIYVTSLSGGAPARLTYLERRSIYSLRWAPDERRLAAVSLMDSGVVRELVDLSTGQTRRLGRILPMGPVPVDLVWIRHGAALLSGAFHKEGTTFTTFDVAGTLEESPLYAADSLWLWKFGAVSPDGQRVAFWGTTLGGEEQGIWTISLEDHSVRKVGKAYGAAPIRWGADDQIYFVKRGEWGYGDTSRDTLAIWRVGATGGTPRLVVTLPTGCRGDVSASQLGRVFTCASVAIEADIWVVDKLGRSPSRVQNH